ncbi:MAG: type I 3-dehydroquinate dehydratase, partial [Nitrospiraceae bacterium]|nr:type I 3-dehydroquinate dehydratase [Nitrospiraceae bacterium]
FSQRPFQFSMPLIAGVLNDEDVRNLPPEALACIDLIELRYDLCTEIDNEKTIALAQQAKTKFGKPLLGTIRHPSEGGGYEVANRVGLYESLAPHVEMVDIEITAAGEFRKLRSICDQTRTVLIGSYHNFTLTPDTESLEVIHATGRSLGADIVKVALMPQNREDVLRIMEFTLRHRTEGIITIAMGETGASSRVFTPLLGSLITYGTVTRSTAPGQLSAQELADLLHRLHIR